MTTTPEQREGLKSRLPSNYRMVVRDRLNQRYSTSYIYMVLMGTRDNDEVLAELVRLAEERKQLQQRLSDVVSEA